MPDQLIPTLMPRYGFRSSKFFGGNFCGNNNFPSSHGVGHLHLLRSGQLVVEHEDGSSFVADQPVCIFYPQPYTHRLTVPEGAQAELICATLEFREAWHNPFLLALPPWMAIPVNRVMGIGEVVEMLSRESASGGLGQAFVVDKLCDILVCQLIRHAQEAGLLKAGVLAGFSDAGIAQALAAVHQDPAHNWRVESMAAVACMSRSAFAKRFHDLVGLSPASYVTGWRLSLAENLLLQQHSVKAVAREVGYGTQQSFARVFMDKHGVSPTSWLAVQGEVRRLHRPREID